MPPWKKQLTIWTTFAAFCLTTYLYLYPIVHGCHFPRPESKAQAADPVVSARVAPFRLLALADPQLEGDTSIPHARTNIHDDGKDDKTWEKSITSYWQGWLPHIHDFVGTAIVEHISWQSRVAGLTAAARNDLLFGSRNLWRSISNFTILSVRERVLSTLDIIPIYQQNIRARVQIWRKHLDLLGNDYYLSHIARSLASLTFPGPTHTVVLGDLLGSQWISDAEFERRSQRFWGRVFRRWRGFARSEHVTDVTGGMDSTKERMDDMNGSREEYWKNHLINVVGNHDVGYAGDIDYTKIERFEKAFGPVNWDVRLTFNTTVNNEVSPRDTPAVDHRPLPELHLIVLNSMSIDVPAFDPLIQVETTDFLQSVIESSTESDSTVGENASAPKATILLTHLPLHKPTGICIDEPMMQYYPEDMPYFAGGLREQNHLSNNSSQNLILNGLFTSLGETKSSHTKNREGPSSIRNGLILNGHDHHGCDIYHTPEEESSHSKHPIGWKASRYNTNFTTSRKGIREVTLRSMMGDFDGSAGLVSGWIDPVSDEWVFDVHMCKLGPPWIWWGVHGFDILVGLWWIGMGIWQVLAFGKNMMRSGDWRIESTRKGPRKEGKIGAVVKTLR